MSIECDRTVSADVGTSGLGDVASSPEAKAGQTPTLDGISVMETALKLTERGLPITVCKGKHPLGDQWQNREWTAGVITAHLESSPTLNVGIVLGERSGIIDIEGDDEKSEAEFLELFDGTEPKTWKYQSKRGFHRLFKYDARLAVNKKAVTKWKTLEIRGSETKACHSLVPPSTTDGFTREWVVAPDECELAELPDSVIRKLVPPPAPTETVKGDKSKGRPGDDFDLNGPTWAEILVPHGWSQNGDDGHGISTQAF